MNKVGVKISIIVLEVVVALFVVSMILKFIHISPEKPGKPAASAEMTDSVPKPPCNAHGLQINVLNATNVSGIADEARYWLRRYGFDVVEIDNAVEKSEKSYIIDCTGKRCNAKLTAKAVGIPDSLIVTKIDTNNLVCVSLVLGSDYKSLNPFKTKSIKQLH